jgi:hypothetical protein
MADDGLGGVKVTFVVEGDPPREISVDVPYSKAKSLGLVDGHRTGQESWTGRRQGADGRWVQRDMLIDREHKPPFKWHRVVDEATGEMIKDEATNLETSERVDLRHEDRPQWLPAKVRYEGPGGNFSEYPVAPDGPIERRSRVYLSAETAQKMGEDLAR